jgi:chitodextrinase
MPTSDASHRRKKSPNCRNRIPFVVSALLVGIVICAAGAAAADHLRGRTPIGDSTSDDLLFGVARTAHLTDASAPSRPKQVVLTSATQTSATISWRRSYDNVGVAGYEVYLFGRPTMRASEPTYAIASLACGTTYRVGVAAYDAASNTSRATWVSVSTGGCGAPPLTAAPPPAPPASDTEPPSAPSNLHVTSSTTTSLGLSWTASTDNVRVTGYDLYLTGVKVWTTAQTSFTHLGLSCGKTYIVAVQAFDDAGNRSPQAQLTSATAPCSPPPPPPADTQPPAKPILSLGPATQTTLELRWQAGVDNIGVHHYNVFRGNSAAAGAQVKITETTALSYVYTQLACGTSYSLALQAQDAAGNKSNLSEAIWYPVTTLACGLSSSPPPPPPPPPPSPLQKIFDQKSDFVPGVFNASGMTEIATPYGPGLRVVAQAGVHVAPWDSGSKAVLGKWFYPSDFLGKTYDWQFHYMFPASGNPQGFPQTWAAGANFEVGHTGQSGHLISVNTSQNPAGQIAIGIHLPPFGNNYAFTWLPSAIELDHWYKVRFQIKWSTGSDGFVNIWIDDVQRVNRAGPTVIAGVIPAMQVGYYSANVLTNEVRFGGLGFNRSG